MSSVVLRSDPSPDDNAWEFRIPPHALVPKKIAKPGVIIGKCVQFTPKGIAFRLDRLPSNRILQDDDPSKFILMSFSEFRFPDTPPRVVGEYINRMAKAGLWLNGIQYRFYHHSNSQLRSRSCFFRQANTDQELDIRIYGMGDFGRIMNIAKRAKRIGLLFSEAPIDLQLDPQRTKDIPDIVVGDEVFSDGCGLISRRLAVLLSKSKRIIFRGTRYTPSVYQIRYLGYKGVLMLHPRMEQEDQTCLAQFRHSMRKFKQATNHTFSVVDYSQPYAFGRLNHDIIVLLNSLGVTNEALLAKQQQYFKWITDASTDPLQGVDFCSALGRMDVADGILLDGIHDPKVQENIRALQDREISSFKKGDKRRTRMLIKDSRLLFGVCDPLQVLNEGEVHVRIVSAPGGARTLVNCDVLVIRNPCLHPGDALKLRAVDHPDLAHLVDCVVFATTAKPGHHPAPSMSSGGDLDGDKFLVCWDKDLVPPERAEPYGYPPNKERVSRAVSRFDLANHFASYNAGGLARVAALHQKWMRCSANGALSFECQELNALHSQSVDGARVKIPDRLQSPPEPNAPFIIELLLEDAAIFVTTFALGRPASGMPQLTSEEAQSVLEQIFRSETTVISEYELFNKALLVKRKHPAIRLQPLLMHLNPGALSHAEKHAISLEIDDEPTSAWLWNSLLQSNIVKPADLRKRHLDQELSLQRLYSSESSGVDTFFQYLRMATQDFTRKALFLKTDNRFAVGIFIRGEVPWDENPVVDDNVVVCTFLPESSLTMTTMKACNKGYRLHCGDGIFQLYNRQVADTFVFINRGPRAIPPANVSPVQVSIALQKVSVRVQTQLGRIRTAPLVGIELHVVSNRDREGVLLFDKWFDHVPTGKYHRQEEGAIRRYDLNMLETISDDSEQAWMKVLLIARINSGDLRTALSQRTLPEVRNFMAVCWTYHHEAALFWTFEVLLEEDGPNEVAYWIEKHPPLTFSLLKTFPPTDDQTLPENLQPMAAQVIRNIIRSGNELGMAVLVALEKISSSVASLSVQQYFELLMLAALSVRAQALVQEVLLVLHECRSPVIAHSDAMAYAHKHALAVAFERAEEAADECPCDEGGVPVQRPRVRQPIVNLVPISDQDNQVKAHVPLTSPTDVRIHSHVRLQAASVPVKGWGTKPTIDGLVLSGMRGELTLQLLHPLPPEAASMQWKMHHAGIIATSQAMMDAILHLVQDTDDACLFHDKITRQSIAPAGHVENEDGQALDPADSTQQSLNYSQLSAVQASDEPMVLIWGPPGTGKTTVVVQILRRIAQKRREGERILVAASTHNAVDNVLERFVEFNKKEDLIPEDHILRVATDFSKVNPNLQDYTIDARVGGDLNENNRLAKRARERVQSAVLVFTTCAGAGLGTLRKAEFDIVIVDEASQCTEPTTLIPLVKGCSRAILVGDHVQLRPTVRKMAQALQHDVSLLERLYTSKCQHGLTRRMLQVQYRFPAELASFPSKEFYQGKLETGLQDSAEVLSVLQRTSFPWPLSPDGVPIPTIFIQCGEFEDQGGRSKNNPGQTALLLRTLPLLHDNGPEEGRQNLQVTVLSPYTKQIRDMKGKLPSGVSCSTIDSFQGRESDIIVFVTVRCNVDRDIGFLEDARRLNVMWTRAKVALIIIGDRATLTENSGLWQRALAATTEVRLPASGMEREVDRIL